MRFHGYRGTVTTARPEFRGDGSPGEFGEVLRAFKRRGCNLLVTGEVGRQVSGRLTRKLLGSTGVDRSRVLVVVGSEHGPLERLLPGALDPSDDEVHVVDHRGGERGGEKADLEPARTVERRDLDALADAVAAAVADHGDRVGGFEPAELRLSVTSLPALLDRYGTDAVAGFLPAVADVVTDRQGMGHYHLPVPDDADVVASLTDPFDARIELRQASGAVAEQRWHVPAYGTTEWVTV